MRYRFLILFIFVLLFIELPLAYVYYTGQQRAVEKEITQIELTDNFLVTRDNPNYSTLVMKSGEVYRILFSSSKKINLSITDQEGFSRWQEDPDNIKPLEFFYQVENVDYRFTPKETKSYYIIFETDPLLAVNASVFIEISSVYKEVLREDIINTIKPILQGTSVITMLLFMISILPKGGVSKKIKGKTFYVLSDEAKAHDVAFLKNIKGFTDKEIKTFLILLEKGKVTEKEIPKLFDIPTFYNLYKMGFIKKITEL